MRTEEAPDLDMIYIMKGSFSEDFKNNSLVGYYDKLSPTLFIRRDLSNPDYQKVNFNSHAGGLSKKSILRPQLFKETTRQRRSYFLQIWLLYFSGILLQTARKMVHWTGSRISEHLGLFQ